MNILILLSSYVETRNGLKICRSPLQFHRARAHAQIRRDTRVWERRYSGETEEGRPLINRFSAAFSSNVVEITSSTREKKHVDDTYLNHEKADCITIENDKKTFLNSKKSLLRLRGVPCRDDRYSLDFASVCCLLPEEAT